MTVNDLERPLRLDIMNQEVNFPMLYNEWVTFKVTCRRIKLLLKKILQWPNYNLDLSSYGQLFSLF